MRVVALAQVVAGFLLGVSPAEGSFWAGTSNPEWVKGVGDGSPPDGDGPTVGSSAGATGVGASSHPGGTGPAAGLAADAPAAAEGIGAPGGGGWWMRWWRRETVQGFTAGCAGVQCPGGPGDSPDPAGLGPQNSTRRGEAAGDVDASFASTTAEALELLKGAVAGLRDALEALRKWALLCYWGALVCGAVLVLLAVAAFVGWVVVPLLCALVAVLRYVAGRMPRRELEARVGGQYADPTWTGPEGGAAFLSGLCHGSHPGSGFWASTQPHAAAPGLGGGSDLAGRSQVRRLFAQRLRPTRGGGACGQLQRRATGGAGCRYGALVLGQPVHGSRCRGCALLLLRDA